jgi:hypothetical protein
MPLEEVDGEPRAIGAPAGGNDDREDDREDDCEDD